MNRARTIGFLGHSALLNLAQSIIIGVASFFFGVVYYPFAANSSLTSALHAAGEISGFMFFAFAVSVVFFLWQLWVNGMAISVANEVSWLKGAFVYLVATIILGIVVALLSTLFVISVYPSGYGLTTLRFTPF